MGKKILCMLLCVMCICPLIANAAPEVKAVDVMQREFTYELPRGGVAPRAEIDISAVRTAELPYASVFSNENTEENHRKAERIIRAAALNNQTTATVPYSLISDLLAERYAFSNWWELVIRDNPDLLFERVAFSINYTPTEAYIPLNYIFETTELDGARAELNSKVDEVVNDIKELGLTRADDICLYVHEYLADRIVYTSNVGDQLEYSPYGALVLGKCVCQGYAEAAKAILDRLGITNILTLSEKANHIWNTILIDGKWYNMDITWDDQTTFRSHKYFMISDATAVSVYKTDDFIEMRKPYIPFNPLYSASCDSELYEVGAATNGINSAAVYKKEKKCWIMPLTLMVNRDGNIKEESFNLYYSRLSGSPLAMSDATIAGNKVFVLVKRHPYVIGNVSMLVKGYTGNGLESISIGDITSTIQNNQYSFISGGSNVKDIADGSGTVYLWDPDTLRPLCAPVSVIKN